MDLVDEKDSMLIKQRIKFIEDKVYIAGQN